MTLPLRAMTIDRMGDMKVRVVPGSNHCGAADGVRPDGTINLRYALRARRIGERLNPGRKAPKAWRDIRTADAPIATGDDVAPSAGAIVIVKRDREEVDAAWRARIKGFHTTRGIDRTSNTSAFDRGRKAGDSASLGGAAKAALKPGPRVLK